MEKVLSIIIPTYNMEEYLRKCLDSLLVSNDNMERLEVLVINDGSKDSSSQIAHEYESKYPQTFRVIDKENGNYGSCVNRGLKEAKGKYVKVLDADDSFVNRTLDIFIPFLDGVNVDLIINNYNVVDEQGQFLEDYSFNLPQNGIFKFNELPKFVGVWLWHHGITYKTSILHHMKYKQTEGISYTDDEWILIPMKYVEDVAYFPHTLYLYLRGREGQTFDENVIRKSLKSRTMVVQSLVDFYYKEYVINNKKGVLGYIHDKLFDRTKALYNLHLMQFSTKEDNDNLRSFDQDLLKKLPDIYKELDNVTNKIGQHYISKWRKNGFRPSYITMKLFRFGALLRKKVSTEYKFLHMPNEYKMLG